MNVWRDASSATNYYYDGDYPSEKHARYPENFDATTAYQGLMHDVARYVELAAEIDGPVLELCCGTGRVALPLADSGKEVVGVDFSAELLRQFKAKLLEMSPELEERITLIQQDVTRLSLDDRRFEMAVIAFNSLLCIPGFDEQRAALESIAGHVSPGGRLFVDIVNPLKLSIDGDPTPKPFFTRRNPHNGARYTRFAAAGPFDEGQRQTLEGWYDELSDEGLVTRRDYRLTWRPIFRYEIELMLDAAGFHVEKIEGGHQGEPYTASSPRMFIHALRGE
jgi:SAM-dependent methyltransferase